MEKSKIRIMLVDDHPVVRSGIVKFLEDEEDIVICGEAGSADEAIKLIEESKPDLMIVDISLGEGASGIELVRAVRDRYPKIVTIILSMLDEAVYAERALRAGAKGYVQKCDIADNIVAAIHRVMSGELHLSRDISDNLVNKLVYGAENTTGTQVDLLTDRELEVFQMIGNGLDIREIAKEMNLSPHTIESHRRNIKEKFQIKSNSELIKRAVQFVLIQSKGL